MCPLKLAQVTLVLIAELSGDESVPIKLDIMEFTRGLMLFLAVNSDHLIATVRYIVDSLAVSSTH